MGRSFSGIKDYLYWASIDFINNQDKKLTSDFWIRNSIAVINQIKKLNKDKLENTYFVKGLIELDGTFTWTNDSP